MARTAEDAKARTREWRKLNPDRCRAYGKKWREKSKAERKERRGADREFRLRQMLKSAKTRASSESMDFDLDLDWLLQMSGTDRCNLTGMQLDWQDVMLVGRRNMHAPSIDRIDSTGGYTKDNCRLVTVWANVARQNMTDGEFLMWCRSVATNFAGGRKH